ncbi:FAD/NAD(P)-binding domain-containing protein [Mycena galericulata]|nr:FAD/NAD(P)-binding domain-containing protein [Mycena galericulata]
MATSDNSTPLKVSIVGAGIAGLAAATALRRQGHIVEIFEAVEVLAEIGAAISVPVNAQRVLEQFGYSKANLDSVNWDGLHNLDAITGNARTGKWLISGMDEKPNVLCHRTDLRNELERLALGPGDGPTPVLHLSSKVRECDVEKGLLELDNGRVIQSDIIIGADGISSMVRTHILGRVQKSISCGWSCYRALIDVATLDGIPDLAWLLDGVSGPRNVAQHGGLFRVLFLYRCRGGTLLNFAAFFEDPDHDDPGWRPEVTREEVQAVFADFHAQFQPVLAALPARVPKWQLRTVPALPTWARGRAVLLGDAAHATLPTLGQGAAMGIEEGAAIAAFLPPGTTRADVPARLEAYQAHRKARGEFVGRESLEQAKIPQKRGEYSRSKEMQEYMMGYDAVKAAEEYFEEKFGQRDLPA